MKPLTCCVIDDEPLAAQLIAAYVKRTPALELRGTYNSAQEAFAEISSGEIDLVFLDIQMPQLSGMELARLLPRDTRIIFTTAYANYAIEGYTVNSVGYLLKPVSYNEFLTAVNRAVVASGGASGGFPAQEGAATPKAEAGAPADNDMLIVKTEYRLRQISKRDILYVEGLKDYVKIYVQGEQRPVMTLLSLKTVERSLANGPFMRVHRSFIVNLTKINTIERSNIIIGTHEIPVSDSFRPDLMEYISAHLPE
ncbi:MAG: LytR/AlgR family response regulator transcription factor [Muribaculaceae bacterium]|nr:LytTR family DNA-binding domain-containing protein [Muribaculaceae bacterium]